MSSPKLGALLSNPHSHHLPFLLSFSMESTPAAEEAAASAATAMETTEAPSAAIEILPTEVLNDIVSHLPLRDAVVCRIVNRLFRQTLASPALLPHLPHLPLLALRGSFAADAGGPHLAALDPAAGRWLRFPLTFLASAAASPVAASPTLLYLWVDSPDAAAKTLAVCNPLTRRLRRLPPLGSAWARHGTVLAAPGGRVLVLSELAVLSLAGPDARWQKLSSSLASKPRSPVIVGGSVYALCDSGSPWRNQWRILSFPLSDLSSDGQPRRARWTRLERHEWGDVFDILKRPRLVAGGAGEILMIGGLRSSYALNATCSTILILGLNLGSLEWAEVGRMPADMYQSFCESGKFKVFGGGGRIWFSGKRVGKLAMWGPGGWRWVEGPPGSGSGDRLVRGFVFDANLTAIP